MKIKLVKNKKGVSPVFVAVYLAMLAILLISVLFGALYIYGTSVTERIKMEEEKQQESVRLVAPPRAIKLGGGDTFVEELRVNNTGSITVRIRALYIGHKFIFDPSRYEMNNGSYINPKGHIWIKFPIGDPSVPKVNWDNATINAVWTVTTERGSKAHEIGIYLYYPKKEDQYNPMRFYIGPLMIMFDMFHWRSGTGPWISGWSIPKGTKDVTWRILISNIDDRDIEVTERSSFTLISNDNSPSAPIPWYIDPVLSSTYYKPGSFYFVYYSLSKPASEGGAKNQSANVFGDGTTCINFLMFLGSFINPNGTRTSYGQTIPFEAVIVTGAKMPSKLTLTANPQTILNDGVSTSTITATVKDAGGNPVPNAWVDFYTTAGTLSATHNTTNAQGVATVKLTSSAAKTTAYVAAICQGVEGTTKVNFTPARKISVSATPDRVSRNGGKSTIKIQLLDANNVTVAQAGVSLTVTVFDNSGNIPSGKNAPILIDASGNEGQQLPVTTNSDGQVILTFQTKGMNKPFFKITADDGPGGLQGGEVKITIL